MALDRLCVDCIVLFVRADEFRKNNPSDRVLLQRPQWLIGCANVRRLLLSDRISYHYLRPDRGLAAHLAHPDGTIIFIYLLRSLFTADPVVGAEIAA